MADHDNCKLAASYHQNLDAVATWSGTHQLGKAGGLTLNFPSFPVAFAVAPTAMSPLRQRALAQARQHRQKQHIKRAGGYNSAPAVGAVLATAAAQRAPVPLSRLPKGVRPAARGAQLASSEALGCALVSAIRLCMRLTSAFAHA